MANNQHNNVIPRHVAIVMDGNGRWAKARFMPRIMGHHKGVEATRKVIRACSDSGVGYLTLFAFSSENWKRPTDEVSGLMSLFMTALEKEAQSLKRHNVSMSFIGDRAAFTPELQTKIAQVEALTADCTGMHLLIAANYGGRWDILQAAQQIAELAKSNQLASQDLSEAQFESYLSTQAIPAVDLFIRTGGEKRISNFLLWQMAYSELYFSDVLWPEFDEQCLTAAFNDFANRQRRFGMTGEQVKGEQNA
ncbi:MAG: polyprenyl diphosphate synthase [Candidatus Thiocaldithrix dubininis]|jgi:undecaprenyl diphosphate synthase|uniref:Ditrans,polycis-undecaprenyl-diphosphate synthase ((2E,6E)-farnesyl-diphosphate specific) n=1 Tax=Candidatus Thiocaldithrix dubininis TaxID=3080823 RepID=A0AA95H9W7_9GAMM|nr:MAG: polyprenyl diphosphate synthase [Candidatus Thiocaldithrix dubininis]